MHLFISTPELRTTVQDAKSLSLLSLQSGSIMNARWPALEGEINEALLKEEDYFHKTVLRCEKQLAKYMGGLKKV